MLNLGVLDQSPIIPGETAADAMRRTLELAKTVERLGYTRYWVSEHHDTPGLAGSSPEVLIAAIAAHTSRIRVGSAGVLLPHYSPYKVAENFRVLEALYPGRIDLGIGRAPGGMPIASEALRYGRPKDREEHFAVMLRDLGGFLSDWMEPGHRFEGVRATPLVDTAPELWLLGSSGFSADRASELGGAFSFAHFINGDGGHEAVRRYFANYRPGPLGASPQANVCVIVICADTDEEAERLAASTDLRLLLLEQGQFRWPFPTPEEAANYPYTDWDRMRIRANRRRMIVGGPEKVRTQMLEFSKGYGVEELIVLTYTYDFQARLRSYDLLAEVFGLGR
ncbi:LLM class flavin-dependent oxidoreductase [Paenibacillus sp. MZ04-78.2]|uniref:LLM class flavin-dependent oxidoreductase n=1 Tax=Paenibacillus sp. MZ04-78.2 TaxID=2962034 RepID=UPI0020B79A61|nr:LLM class flavin-dependent oxidoreductase [Paenibacillus sp. MZ04-78.2]MCP3775123.1 LLM class flavin-dependent oxidoreductase [Paenibacillus sp. MZ04-78.2]